MNTLKPGHDEFETSAVWVTLCAELFPATEGYVTASKGRSGGGCVDLYTMHTVTTPQFNQKHFFVVECKPPGDETQDSIWGQPVVHLRGYLEGIKGNQNRRIFGAVAVGKVVRFYEFSDGHLSDLNGDSTIYYIDRQCHTVTEKLTYIRNSH